MTDTDLAKSLPADPSDALRTAIDEAAAAVDREAKTHPDTIDGSDRAAIVVADEVRPATEADAVVAAGVIAPTGVPRGVGPAGRRAALLATLKGGQKHAAQIPAHVARHPRAVIAAGLALTALVGFAGGRLVTSGAQADLAGQRWSEATLALRQSQDEVMRLAGEVRTVRNQVEAMRSERQRTDIPAKLAQTNERLEKGTADHTARLAKLTDQIERLEKAQRDPSRIAGIVERLDRIERQTLTAAERVVAPVPPSKPTTIAVPTAAAADVGQTGSLAAVSKTDRSEAKPGETRLGDTKSGDTKPVDAKTSDAKTSDLKTSDLKPSGPKLASVEKALEPDLRKTQLDTYVLRDIGDGVALIEARNGRLIEVRPGQALGTGNKVEAIERRGRHWVVVTAKGFIAER